MRHQPGEFPVQFLGSRDYYWIHRGRVFSYQEGDKGSTDSGNNKNLAKVFKKGNCVRFLHVRQRDFAEISCRQVNQYTTLSLNLHLNSFLYFPADTPATVRIDHFVFIYFLNKYFTIEWKAILQMKGN